MEMKLSKIRILNYKSIKDVTIDVKQHSNSYTTIFVGRNETGKSNILEAIEFLSEPDRDFNFEALKNAQNDTDTTINFLYTYSFDNDIEWKDILKSKLSLPDELFANIHIMGIEKNIIIASGCRKIKSVNSVIKMNINESFLSKFLYKKGDESSQFEFEIISEKEYSQRENSEYKKLGTGDFDEILNLLFDEVMLNNKLNVTKWRYSNEYLITNTIDLNLFKEDNSISHPLKNIFKLANLKTSEDIKNKIESLLIGPKNINKLEKVLENSATDYVTKIWPESKVRFKFKIQDDLKLSVYVIDEADEENSFYMSDRSEGFKQFISLILSISAENNSDTLKNNIIIIDEPEIHMHPSGIKYMKNELIRIGLHNYLFIATHSEFMIDTENKERHYIVTKRNNNTHVERWESNDFIPDDEVLRQAFGVGIVREMLSQYSINGDKQIDNILTDRALKTLYPELCCLNESGVKKIENVTETPKETAKINVGEAKMLESSGVLAQKFKEIVNKTKQCFNSDKKINMPIN